MAGIRWARQCGLVESLHAFRRLVKTTASSGFPLPSGASGERERTQVRFGFLVIAAAVCLLSILAHPPGALAQSPSDVTIRPLSRPLSFVDGQGRAVTTADFAGTWLFVYFGYMHCADQCPLGLTVMGNAIDEVGRAARHLQPLFVTVDPERDRGEPLARFAVAFHERLIGLTGSSDEIAAAAAAMGVVFRKAQQGDDYSVDHSSSYSLVDPARSKVITFKDAEPHLVAHRIIAELTRAGVDLSDVATLGALR
jgi:protein SCO1